MATDQLGVVIVT